MDIFSLVARLTLDKSNYDAGLDDAAAGAKGFASKMGSGLATAAKVGTAAMAAVGTATTAATAAMVKGAGEVSAYGDNIDKASQKLGISAEAYQEWDAVLQHSGTSIDSMGIGMKTLANAAATGSDAFTALGISAEQAASMSREDLFAETITALQKVTNENERAQLAQELFGRSAMELGPLLNTSAKETLAMRKRVHELGGVMSNEAVKASARYQDSFQDLTTALEGTKRNMMSNFLPGISDVMDGLAELMIGGEGLQTINQGIESIVQSATEMIPQVMEVGTQIIMSLAGAILQNLPAIIDAATQTIITLTTGIIQQLPMLIEAGLQILIALANAISENLPTLIPTIVEVVLQIVDTLTEPSTLSALVDASIAIIVALAKGLIDALPKLIEKGPEIIKNIVKSLIDNVPKIFEAGVQLIDELAKGIVQNVVAVVNAIGDLGRGIIDGIGEIISSAWDWGKDLINNFTDGIKAFINKPINAVKDLASKIANFLGFSEPEEGPLSNFHTYAPDMMQLFADGIEKNKSLITDAIDGAFNFGPTITGGVSGHGEMYKVPRGGNGGGERNIIIPIMIDGREFARAEVPYIEAEQNRVGIKLSGGYA